MPQTQYPCGSQPYFAVNLPTRFPEDPNFLIALFSKTPVASGAQCIPAPVPVSPGHPCVSLDGANYVLTSAYLKDRTLHYLTLSKYSTAADLNANARRPSDQLNSETLFLTNGGTDDFYRVHITKENLLAIIDEINNATSPNNLSMDVARYKVSFIGLQSEVVAMDPTSTQPSDAPEVSFGGYFHHLGAYKFQQ